MSFIPGTNGNRFLIDPENDPGFDTTVLTIPGYPIPDFKLSHRYQSSRLLNQAHALYD